jgi:FkbM family methyltransferase
VSQKSNESQYLYLVFDLDTLTLRRCDFCGENTNCARRVAFGVRMHAAHGEPFNAATGSLALTGRQPSIRAVEETHALGAALVHPYNLAASLGRATEPGMPSTSCYFSPSEGRRQALAYDIGVNQAGDARHLLFAGYRVVSVEADPTKYRKHLADATLTPYLTSGQWTLVNAAVVGRGGGGSNITFYINHRKPDSSSTDSRLACSVKCTPVDVPTLTCGELLHQYGPAFFLKADIEGMLLADIERVRKHSILPTMTRIRSLVMLRARRRLLRNPAGAAAKHASWSPAFQALVFATICAI